MVKESSELIFNMMDTVENDVNTEVTLDAISHDDGKRGTTMLFNRLIHHLMGPAV